MGAAGVFINVIFIVLNLLPLPPLDGGRILVSLLPHRLAHARFARGAVRLHHPDRAAFH